MHSIKSIQRCCFLSLYLLMLALPLVACSNPTKAIASASASSTSGAASTASNSNKPLTGCPGNAVASQPGNANIVVTTRQMNQTITAHTGDIIEIQLPLGHKWTGPTTSQGILQLQGPAGYTSQSANACIWRFVAKGPGTVQLMFHSQALCQAGQICPMYITAIPFNFRVG
jgi:hypothetical protein